MYIVQNIAEVNCRVPIYVHSYIRILAFNVHHFSFFAFSRFNYEFRVIFEIDYSLLRSDLNIICIVSTIIVYTNNEPCQHSTPDIFVHMSERSLFVSKIVKINI